MAGKRIGINHNDWQRRVNNVSNRNSDVTPRIKLEISRNRFEGLTRLVSEMRNLDSVVSRYCGVVRSESSRMSAAGTRMVKADQTIARQLPGGRR
jgi:hypothetical protein